MFGLALGLTFSLPTGTALAQGTAFTYQGRLDSNGAPFNGNAEFQATLWTAATGGTQVAANNPAAVVVDVNNGLFTLRLDFGANFPGADRWLQLEVRTSIGPFTTLNPRQALTPTPYALTAKGISGNLPASQLSGTVASGQLGGTYSGAVIFNNTGNVFSGNGSGLTGVNAVTVGGVSGTNLWKLSGNSGVRSGQFLGTTDNQPLEFRVNGQQALRFEPNSYDRPSIIGGKGSYVASEVFAATIGGGYANIIQTDAYYSTIGGGIRNTIQTDAYYSTIGGGNLNTIQNNAFDSTIGGGWTNTIQTNAYFSTIGGGGYNTIQTNANSSTIGGGFNNTIRVSAASSTIGGGCYNTIQTNATYSTIGCGYYNLIQTNADYATIGGGSDNTIQANSDYATIPGGYKNSATNYAFAAGRNAKANHTGSFVWGDSTAANIASAAINSVTFRAAGGYRLFSNSGASAGVSLAANGTAWAVISDRNVKKDFAPVDTVDVLEKLAALPITQWRYQWEEENVTPHLGPMAQDFKAAFYPGTDDITITTQEADGVALAAIQGLNRKLETEANALRTENAELKSANQTLAQRVERLEQLINQKLNAN
ncbi:MAG TPA: tail fiber domain-containing protein [Verrucomicrobiota bacterium]|nr:tail fiber domain-containing protein [Verrucomicrobiota bacterium]